MRWPTIVATVCSISSSDRLSRKHRANRSISPTARSAAPSNIPPASEVILPPSKAPTTERPSTRANPNRSALHSVASGLPLILRQTVATTRFSQKQSPDAPLSNEKSRLAGGTGSRAAAGSPQGGDTSETGGDGDTALGYGVGEPYTLCRRSAPDRLTD